MFFYFGVIYFISWRLLGLLARGLTLPRPGTALLRFQGSQKSVGRRKEVAKNRDNSGDSHRGLGPGWRARVLLVADFPGNGKGEAFEMWWGSRGAGREQGESIQESLLEIPPESRRELLAGFQLGKGDLLPASMARARFG